MIALGTLIASDRECKNLASELDVLETLESLKSLTNAAPEDLTKIREITEDIKSLYDA